MAILYNIFTYTKGGVTGVHLRGVAYKGGELLCRVIYYRVCAPVRCCLLQGVRFFAVLYTTGCALLRGVVYFRVCALCGVVYTVGYTSPRFRLHWRGASPQRHLLYIGVRSSAVSPIPHMRYSQGRPHNVRTLNTWQSYCLHGWTYCLAGVGGLVDYRTFLIIRNLKIHFRQFCMNTVLFECMEIRTTLCLFLWNWRKNLNKDEDKVWVVLFV